MDLKRLKLKNILILLAVLATVAGGLYLSSTTDTRLQQGLIKTSGSEIQQVDNSDNDEAPFVASVLLNNKLITYDEAAFAVFYEGLGREVYLFIEYGDGKVEFTDEGYGFISNRVYPSQKAYDVKVTLCDTKYVPVYEGKLALKAGTLTDRDEFISLIGPIEVLSLGKGNFTDGEGKGCSQLDFVINYKDGGNEVISDKKIDDYLYDLELEMINFEAKKNEEVKFGWKYTSQLMNHPIFEIDYGDGEKEIIDNVMVFGLGGTGDELIYNSHTYDKGGTFKPKITGYYDTVFLGEKVIYKAENIVIPLDEPEPEPEPEEKTEVNLTGLLGGGNTPGQNQSQAQAQSTASQAQTQSAAAVSIQEKITGQSLVEEFQEEAAAIVEEKFGEVADQAVDAPIAAVEPDEPTPADDQSEDEEAPICANGEFNEGKTSYCKNKDWVVCSEATAGETSSDFKWSCQGGVWTCSENATQGRGTEICQGGGWIKCDTSHEGMHTADNKWLCSEGSWVLDFSNLLQAKTIITQEPEVVVEQIIDEEEIIVEEIVAEEVQLEVEEEIVAETELVEPIEIELSNFKINPKGFFPHLVDTVISFKLSAIADVEIKISDKNGVALASFVIDELEAGDNEIAWDGKDNNEEFVVGGTHEVKIIASDPTSQLIKDTASGKVTVLYGGEDFEGVGLNGQQGEVPSASDPVNAGLTQEQMLAIMAQSNINSGEIEGNTGPSVLIYAALPLLGLLVRRKLSPQ